MVAASSGRLEVYFLVDNNPSKDKGVAFVGYFNEDIAAWDTSVTECNYDELLETLRSVAALVNSPNRSTVPTY